LTARPVVPPMSRGRPRPAFRRPTHLCHPCHRWFPVVG